MYGYRYGLCVLLWVGIIILPNSALAKLKKFKIENHEVALDVPESWQVAEKYLEVPVTILGPAKAMAKEGGARPVLMLRRTSLNIDKSFDTEKLEKNQTEYKAGRENWLHRHGGRSIAYFPYQKETWKGVSEVHSIGYQYELANQQYIEKNFYVVCNKELYHMSTLLSTANEKEYTNNMKNLTESFICKR